MAGNKPVFIERREKKLVGMKYGKIKRYRINSGRIHHREKMKKEKRPCVATIEIKQQDSRFRYARAFFITPGMNHRIFDDRHAVDRGLYIACLQVRENPRKDSTPFPTCLKFPVFFCHLIRRRKTISISFQFPGFSKIFNQKSTEFS